MRKAVFIFLSALSVIPLMATQVIATQEESEAKLIENPAPFHPFTGKVTRNKVRLRLQPSLESPILRELSRGELLAVLGETEEFYAIKPPSDLKAYVFRTFVLDHVIEGNHVNVRLEPDLEAPVLAQLNSGDTIQGQISALNSKWFEITPPDSSRVFVSKDYVEKVGDVEMMATLEKKRGEVNELLNHAYKLKQTEFEKPFSLIQIEALVTDLKHIVTQYTEFPNQIARAKELMAEIQELYLQKKIAFLEEKAKNSQEKPDQEDSKLDSQIKKNTEELDEMRLKFAQAESSLQGQPPLPSSSFETESPQEDHFEEDAHQKTTAYSSPWNLQEERFYVLWKEHQPEENSSLEDFYKEQEQDAIVLKGILEPYSRTIKNKPGDYVLLSQATKQPIAYLYSTRLNLEEKVKQIVILKVAPRPNYHFAYPAYFALEME